MPYMSIDVQNMTISSCIAACSKFGYDAGGVEYGYQCCEWISNVCAFGKN